MENSNKIRLKFMLKHTNLFGLIFITILLGMFSISNGALAGEYMPKATATPIADLVADDTVFVLTETETDMAISRPVGVGDVNDDGYDDFLLQAFGTSPDSPEWWLTNKGEVFLYLGGPPGSLSDLTSTDADASFTGETTTGYFGNPANAGDVNGDGINDFMIAEPENDETVNNAGKVFFVFGKAEGWAMDTPITSAADASYYGEGSADKLGQAWLTGIGDINNDGYDDVAIASQLNDEAYHNAGQIYIILGKQTSDWEKNIPIAEADGSLHGESADFNLGQISRAGDVNGDGNDDFLVSSWVSDVDFTNAGKSYLFLGGDRSWQMDMVVDNAADASFVGYGAGMFSSAFFDGFGDLNNDGYDDFVINAPGANGSAIIGGETHVFLGSASISWGANTSLSASDASYFGTDNNDNAGLHSSITDVNNDGYSDMIISAPWNDTGKVHIVLGGSSLTKNTSLSTADMTFTGESSDLTFGNRVNSIGDFDNNGYNDFIIRAPEFNVYDDLIGGNYYLMMYLYGTPTEQPTSTSPSTTSSTTSTTTTTPTSSSSSEDSDDDDSPLLLIPVIVTIFAITVIRSRKK